MKIVHHLAVIGQPAFVEGLTVNCPHCNHQARVREDGSALCIEGNKSFEPERTDGELFAMRQAFDAKNGINYQHRLIMVPTVIGAHQEACA
jgi:hypothetical protein